MRRAREVRIGVECLAVAAVTLAAGCDQAPLARLELAEPRTVFGPEAVSDTGPSAADFELAMPRAVVASASQVVIADQLNHRVVVFDHDLRPVRLVGRPGSGPGEIRAPVGLRLRDDSIAVGDQGNQRLTFFTNAGEVLRTMSVPVRPARFVMRGAASVVLPNPSPTHYLMEVDTGGGSRLLAPRLLRAYGSKLLDGRGQPMQYSGDLVAEAEDGGVWVFDNAAGLLLRFAPDGEMSSAVRLPLQIESTLERRRKEFVEALERGGMRVAMAPLAKDLIVADDGRLLLLFTTETYGGLLIDPLTRQAAPLRLPADSATGTPLAHARAGAMRGDRLWVVDGERAYRYRLAGEVGVATAKK